MIETERLRLRPLTDADRDWNAAQFADPEIMVCLGGPQSRDAADGRVDYMMALERSQGFSFSVMELKEGGERIGLCGLKLFDAVNASLPGVHEIGWRLDPRWWGRGYAREAASAWLDIAFGRLAAPIVVALTVARNRPSWGLMERLGMVRRPDLDFADPRVLPEDQPAILYALEPDQWQRS